jgi:quercetin dioxygenase-like cupin family protein
LRQHKFLTALNPKPTTDTSQDVQRATVYDVAGILEYASNSSVTRKILDKPTGSVTAVACDAGVVMNEKISAFDTLVLVLDGSVDVRIDRRQHRLVRGQCIIMPAHFRNQITSDARFKVLLTVIKSGYENSL